MTKAHPKMARAMSMKKMPPNVHSLTEQDHLPSARRLRVQVMTNSKGYMELNLNHRGLRMVPAETFQMSTTQVLRLDHNYIDFLPMMIAYLRSLRVLDLQHNVLIHLPETLVNCKHLAELRMTANRLSALPRSFGGLRNLRILELGENQLEQLPQEIGQLSSLRILDLHSNRLWHVPFSLQELRHLIQLNLSDNMFDHVPLVVTRITSLKALNLSRNRLGSLPLDLDALRGLRELNLSHNKLVTVSSLLITLRNLKYLSLANNSLKFLPPQMSRLQNLRVLHLQDNQLRQVPSCLRNLRYYNVATNQLTSFSVEGLRNLISLTASRNRMETVPKGLYKLKKLKFLYLDNNCLVELDEAVHSLTELRMVDLSHNNLVCLPKAIHTLPLLHSFTIKGNYKLSQSTKGSRKQPSSSYHDNDYNSKEKDEKMKRYLLAKGSRVASGHGMKITTGEVLFSHETASEGRRLRRDGQVQTPRGHKTEHWDPGRRRSFSDLQKDDRCSINTPTTIYGSVRRTRNDQDFNGSVGKSTRSRGSHISEHRHGKGTAGRRHDVPDSQRLFMGRGVALPGAERPTLNMTSSQHIADSMRKKEKASESGSYKKSKFYSVKSFKDLFRRIRKSNSSHSSIDIPKGTMRSSNSITFPVAYNMDEIDQGRIKSRKSSLEGFLDRRSRPVSAREGDYKRSKSQSTKSKNRSADSQLEYDKEYSDGEDVIGHRRIGYMQPEDERDWRSLSHGYGSWRSKNHVDHKECDNWSADSKAKNYMIPDFDMSTRTDEKTGFKNRERNSNMRRSFSSDTVTSEFSYREYTYDSDNDQMEYKQQRTEHFHGNKRFSSNGQIGSQTARPSSRSRWLGQWYGPDYESSLTKSEYDNQSHDYSVREAIASFATETTATRRLDGGNFPKRHRIIKHDDTVTDSSLQMTMPIRNRRPNQNLRIRDSKSNNDHYIKPRRHLRVSSDKRLHDSPSRYSMKSWHSDSVLNTENLTTNQRSRRDQGYSQLKQNAHKNKYASKERLLERANKFEEEDDDIFIGSTDSEEDAEALVNKPEEKISSFDLKGRGRTLLSAPASSRVSHITDYVESDKEGSQSQRKHGFLEKVRSGNTDYCADYILRSKSLSEFDNILTTNEYIATNEFESKVHKTLNEQSRAGQISKRIKQLDENFTVKERTLPRGRSMDSLLDQTMLESTSYSIPVANDGFDENQHADMGSRIQAISAGDKGHIARTDYTLLGVCNQIETLINKNVLQPVIGWKGSQKFSDKVIQKTTDGMWRLGDGDDTLGHGSNYDLYSKSNNSLNGYNAINGNKSDQSKLRLNYYQPQMFSVTSYGGQFVTSDCPEVKVTVPAHAVDRKLQVTIQVLKIPAELVTRAKRLNHFIDNIIFISPIVYFYTCQDQTFNSPVTISFPAPRAVKGGHLLVLTIKRDNSCVPCNSGYRSGVMEASVSVWQFAAKVAVITQARCKYKACKSVENLLECVGASQV